VNVRVAPGSVRGLPYLEVGSAIPCKIEGDHSISRYEIKANTTSLWCLSVKAGWSIVGHMP
jgi:hypothetical protein